ncbi:RNA polymerase sigma-70 factor, ECF subfamily [Hydrobacter penzbergensis]|uniref:RNA polymerase sigma-70 factor, ECF subfamily n=1 Tax=Hydrobacter penzbergensis TaxID=1235997 RepID=A0A8X8LDK3_9BACT|nr:sigma-70 family RNA polymerase sigma factor [Hydrobacter penzbergensis]SDW16932.1 RNA polymerase sigma-70 factor, ECF subfamily [Hydrobacter penzbergensis]
MTYTEIISQIDQKDRKGWETLYLLYGKKFYGFAVDNWKFNEDEAWEIVYQTLQTIILKIGEYEIQSQRHFDNLIFKIFINFLRQQYRKNKTISQDFKVLSFSEMEMNSEDDDLNVDELKNPFSKEFFLDYTDSEETENPKLKELQLALSKLEPVEKDLLLLKANGFSYEQIADMLKIENNQLKVKHHRAKKKLIKLLQTTQITNDGK